MSAQVKQDYYSVYDLDLVSYVGYCMFPEPVAQLLLSIHIDSGVLGHEDWIIFFLNFVIKIFSN